ncbi:hypothetical protein ABZP36_006400 [Zizania latifolia]
MDPRQHSVYPGSGSSGRGSGERGRRSGRGSGERGRRSGSGESGSSSGGRRRGSEGSGNGSVDTSMTQRRHISAQSMGTRLMPEFNAAAGGDDGRLFGSSLGGFDLELEESPLRYFRHCVQPEASQRPNLGRLFLRSPVGSPTRDDEVIVMDGVLVDNVSVSSPRRSSSSFSNVGFVPACSTGSCGRNRYDFNRQMEPQVGRAVQGAGFNMQTPLTPRGLPICPPSHPGAIALGGAMTVPIRPHGYPYFMPQRPTAASTRPPPGFLARNQQLPPQPPQQQRTASMWPPKAAAAVIPAGPPSSSAPKQPETKPPAVTKEPEETKPPVASSSAPREVYTWPLTEEEDAYITDLLYTPSGRRRLPVFRSICPD